MDLKDRIDRMNRVINCLFLLRDYLNDSDDQEWVARLNEAILELQRLEIDLSEED